MNETDMITTTGYTALRDFNLADAMRGIDHRIANLEFQTGLARHVIPFPNRRDEIVATQIVKNRPSAERWARRLRRRIALSDAKTDHQTSGRPRL